jgi:very-short-patch-repair endonuclease
VARLVVELDGDSHIGREEYDHERDEFLRAQGLSVLRIPNGHVYEESEAVIELISRVCAERAAANPKVAHKVDAEGRFRPTPGS